MKSGENVLLSLFETLYLILTKIQNMRAAYFATSVTSLIPKLVVGHVSEPLS
jgi:hypothetical protein